jgi:hypothetical protein
MIKFLIQKLTQNSATMNTKNDFACDYCGQSYYAERSTKKYCSDSCKTMACRKRKSDSEQALLLLQKFKQDQETHQRWLDEFAEKNRIEKIARQEEAEREMIERQKQADVERQERNEKKDKENALKRQKHEQRMAELRKTSQNQFTAQLFGGLVNHIIVNLSEPNGKEEKKDGSDCINKTDM